MRGFLHGSKIIAHEKGIRGFFQGFLPTTARQAANSAVRFSSYTSLKQLAQSYTSPGEKLGAFSTFGLGGLAGIITVYTTMPIDTVKTRMQSIEASAQYKNSVDCVVKIFKQEGLLTFWSGAVPRLGRLILSGGIVFTMYVFRWTSMPLVVVNQSQVREVDGTHGQAGSSRKVHLNTVRLVFLHIRPSDHRLNASMSLATDMLLLESHNTFAARTWLCRLLNVRVAASDV
jgi:hypothetical protein